MSGAARPQPTLLASAMRVFDLSLGQMLWSRRSVFLSVLVSGPVLMGAALRLATILFDMGLLRGRGPRVSGLVIFGTMMWLLYIRFIVPILGVFYGTALIADEVDDKTITYLFTRPIPRSAVLLGKYMAYLVCTVLMLLPSIVITFFLVVPLGGGSVSAAFPSLVADLGMAALGLAAYGAVFAFVGARMKRPLVVGLMLVLGLEPAVSLVPGYLKRLTVSYYLQALVMHEMPDDTPLSAFLQVFHEVPSVLTGLVGLAVITGVALWLAGRTVERREYVLDQ